MVYGIRALADLAAFPVVVDATLVQQVAELSSTEHVAFWDAVAELSSTEHVAFWDALVLTSAAEAGAGTVYSEDLQPGRSYRGVTVVDPFAA